MTKKIIAIILLSILLVGCKDFFLKKAIKMNPEFFKDSVEIRHYSSIDTFFVLQDIDTFYIDTNGVKTSLVKNYNNYRITQVQRPDTVRVTEIVKVEETKNDFLNKYGNRIFWVSVIFLSLIFILILTNLINATRF